MAGVYRSVGVVTNGGKNGCQSMRLAHRTSFHGARTFRESASPTALAPAQQLLGAFDFGESGVRILWVLLFLAQQLLVQGLDAFPSSHRAPSQLEDYRQAHRPGDNSDQGPDVHLGSAYRQPVSRGCPVRMDPVSVPVRAGQTPGKKDAIAPESKLQDEIWDDFPFSVWCRG